MNDDTRTTTGTPLCLATTLSDPFGAEARLRFATTGPTALPLTTKQAAYILNRTPGAVNQLVGKKRLQRLACGMFHPDAIRAFLEGKR